MLSVSIAPFFLVSYIGYMNVIHPKVQYSLTPFGRTLAPIILMMRDWDQESIIKRKQAAREPVTSEI